MKTSALYSREEKLAWGMGPWVDEPDRAEWRHGGIACLLLRRAPLGAWCGYVAVPPGHPWHGTRGGVGVHGGVNYAGPCADNGVCHVPEPGEPDDVWWLGFDCAHGFDHAPGLMPHMPESLSSVAAYRTFEYAKAEAEALAEQIRAAAGGRP